MDGPSFLAETAADTAEFEAVRDAVETEAPAPAAPPAPEPKAEPVAETPKPAEPAKPAEPKQEERKFVPHAALHEERTKRQAADARIAALEAALAARDGKVPGQPEAPAEIDPETDPIAALKEIKAWQKQQSEQGERQQQEQDFVSRVQSHEADFAVATPDYAAAITYLRESRANEIIGIAKAMGHALSQEQLGAQLRHEALSTANEALQRGLNPGEVYYKLAQARGYALKAAEPAPAKAEEPDPVVSKASNETIDRITRGQKAAAVRGGGDPPDTGGEMTLESLAKLEGAAFDKAFEKFSKAQRNVH